MASTGAVAAAADADPRALQDLVTNLDRAAAPLARENAALAAAVAELPRTLRAGIPALAALDASFPSVRTLVAELRPAVRSTLPSSSPASPSPGRSAASSPSPSSAAWSATCARRWPR